MEEKKRHRPPRLKEYDYTSPGYYFVTFNTRMRNQDVLCVLEEEKEDAPPRAAGPTGGTGPTPPSVAPAAFGGPAGPLTRAGIILNELVQNIDRVYPAVHVDTYVIMPDHVHLLLAFYETSQPRPPLGNIINTLKSLNTKRLGYSIWQDEFYDHIIRNQTDLEETSRYIVNNPLKRMNSNG